MSGLAIGAAISATCLGVLAFMVWRAKPGFEDSDGFHEGDEHARDDNLGI